MFNYSPWERWFRYKDRINDERVIAKNAGKKWKKLKEDLDELDEKWSDDEAKRKQLGIFEKSDAEREYSDKQTRLKNQIASLKEDEEKAFATMGGPISKNGPGHPQWSHDPTYICWVVAPSTYCS